MNELPDITTLDDIKTLVNAFYGKVQQDKLLAPIFYGVIRDQWPVHLEKMYRFWQTVLLEEHTYFGSPFPPHGRLPITRDHFDAWLKLWHETVDSLFQGERATEARWRAGRMAVVFLSKLAGSPR